jgi:hypothetical protein
VMSPFWYLAFPKLTLPSWTNGSSLIITDNHWWMNHHLNHQHSHQMRMKSASAFNCRWEEPSHRGAFFSGTLMSWGHSLQKTLQFSMFRCCEMGRVIFFTDFPFEQLWRKGILVQLSTT